MNTNSINNKGISVFVYPFFYVRFFGIVAKYINNIYKKTFFKRHIIYFQGIFARYKSKV